MENPEQPKTAEQINSAQTGTIKEFANIPLARPVAEAGTGRRKPAEVPASKPIVRTGRIGAEHPGHRGLVADVAREIAADTAITEHWRTALLAEINGLKALAVEVGFHPHRRLLRTEAGDVVEESFGSWHCKKIF